MNIPEDIYDAFLRCAKAWLLNNYVGNRKMLVPMDDHYASLISIHSYSLPGGTGKNLRRLLKLARDGVILESQRSRSNRGVRSFTLPRHQLNEIGALAVKEWESVGYVVGQMMPKIQAMQQEAVKCR